MMINERGTLDLPDHPGLSVELRTSAASRLAQLRSSYDDGDEGAALEAFLLLASIDEWERRTGATAKPDVALAWGSDSLPVGWTEGDVAHARALWRAIRKATTATADLRRARGAADVERALRNLLGSIWNAKTAVGRLG